MLYSITLNCPCSTKTISYRSFVSLSPTLHQVCSSGFVADDWLKLLKKGTTIHHPNDWRNRAWAQFQQLSDFCRLANKTIDDSVDRFLKQFFIASNAFNEINFDTQLNATLRQFYTSTIFDFSLQNNVVRLLLQIDQPYMGPSEIIDKYFFSNLIITNIENEKNNRSLRQVSFVLPGIPEINSTVLTCICATNPHCQGLNVIYTPELAHDDTGPLINDPTRSRFPPNTLVSTIFKEMMVEQWNVSSSYKDFYESCAPIYCTYSEKIRTKTISGIILTLMSVIGGLVVSLRLITPYLVRFFYYLWEKINNRQQSQQQDEQ
ncbi:unnamed protein product, partial [Adineta steineri]